MINKTLKSTPWAKCTVILMLTYNYVSSQLHVHNETQILMVPKTELWLRMKRNKSLSLCSSNTHRCYSCSTYMYFILTPCKIYILNANLLIHLVHFQKGYMTHTLNNANPVQNWQCFVRFHQYQIETTQAIFSLLFVITILNHQHRISIYDVSRTVLTKEDLLQKGKKMA